MKFRLIRTSVWDDDNNPNYIDIKDINNLKTLYENVGCSLILDFDENIIEIYDDWRE